MKPSPWKYLLSYLTEVPLEKASTPLNPELDLSLRNGRYYLTTPNAVYSYGDLYRNFHQSFNRIHLEKTNIRDVLILGFGMGSIPWMLEKKFHQNYRYTGVEADEAIAAWAEKYILPELHSKTKIIREDAFSFVKNCDEKFDLIAVDVFLDDLVPLQFDRSGFWGKLRSLLSKDGLLLCNRLVDTEACRVRTEAFFEKTFKPVFPGATYLDLDVNWMLMNCGAKR